VQVLKSTHEEVVDKCELLDQHLVESMQLLEDREGMLQDLQADNAVSSSVGWGYKRAAAAAGVPIVSSGFLKLVVAARGGGACALHCFCLFVHDPLSPLLGCCC
jgi:tryptophan synthase beta subunit